MTLNTRPPTGRAPWPTILVEGDEKAGKSYAAAIFTASSRTGRSFWIDLAEGAGDEYGPLGNYEYVIHDGTFGQIHEQITEIATIAKHAHNAGEPPVVLVVDGINSLWDSLKDWINGRARRTKYARAQLAKDPDAEIKVAPFLWNDANDRWRRIINPLLTFPGIVIITARGKEVSAMGPDGNPVVGKKEWRVEAQKTLGFDVSAWIRLHRDSPAEVIGVRSINPSIGFRPGSSEPRPLPDGWTLEWFVFDALGLNPAAVETRDYRPVDAGVNLPPGMTHVPFDEWLAGVRGSWEQLSLDDVGRVYQEAVARGFADRWVPVADGTEIQIGDLLQARGNELLARVEQSAPPTPAAAQQPQQPVPAAPGPPPAPTAAAPAPQQPTPPQPPAAAPAPQTGGGSVAEVLEFLAAVDLATRLPELKALWRSPDGQRLLGATTGDGRTVGEYLTARANVLKAGAA